MIDTLSIHDTLKKGEIPETQARAITSAIMQAEANKTEDFKAFIVREREEMDWRFETVRKEMATKADLAEFKAEIVRWMFLFWVGQVGVTVTLIKLIH